MVRPRTRRMGRHTRKLGTLIAIGAVLLVGPAAAQIDIERSDDPDHLELEVKDNVAFADLRDRTVNIIECVDLVVVVDWKYDASGTEAFFESWYDQHEGHADEHYDTETVTVDSNGELEPTKRVCPGDVEGYSGRATARDIEGGEEVDLSVASDEGALIVL